MQDFRDAEPAWVRYAEFVGGGHDKYYEVRVDLGDDGLYYTTRRWGRRPDTGAGQIKNVSSQSMDYAIRVATHMLSEKIAKGYRECERPMGASRKVPQDWND